MAESARREAPTLTIGAWGRSLPAATRYAFYGGPEARAAASPIWGAPFSETACRATTRGERTTLWCGPDEYLLVDRDLQGDPAALPAQMSRALSHVPHALVDISHRQIAFEVSGASAAAILGGACPLDLDLDEFPVDMCTRTLLAKADILLWRTREDAFHVEVWRSFAGYATALLNEIAAEFYPPTR
ncbi:MAG: sarcosine oxidase subunit gamma [Pseudomonadota bacterium]|nr:sarcosine oxidase subunit gamma [Pseudomonadota bacterium]